jgi:hypothetical protein
MAPSPKRSPVEAAQEAEAIAREFTAADLEVGSSWVVEICVDSEEVWLTS